MRRNRLIVALTAVLLCTAAAPDQIIHQRGRAFSTAALTVARGDQVVFLNDDTVPHNIMSTSNENGFDLGLETPGHAIPVSFTKAGLVTVICAIHPRMHMTITVTD
jgi:plastocyanin